MELVLRRKSQRKIMILKTSPDFTPSKNDFFTLWSPGYVHVWINYWYFEKKSEQFCLKIRSTLICSNIHHRSQNNSVEFESKLIEFERKKKQSISDNEIRTNPLMWSGIFTSEKEVCLNLPVCRYLLFVFIWMWKCLQCVCAYIAEILLWNK